MRRVLAFLDSEAAMWKRRATFEELSMDAVGYEGYRSYALQQAALSLGLREQFDNMWRFVDRYVALGGKAQIFPEEVSSVTGGRGANDT